MSGQANTIVRAGGNYRWAICALLFFVITINYIDRQVLGVLKPLMDRSPAEGGLGWSETDYGNVVSAFQASYGIGLLLVGRLLDKVGTRWGMAVAIALWSVAAMFHSVARTVLAFLLARVMLGIAESAAYPGAVKSVAEWFPKRERALGVGFLNAGANVGVMTTPIVGLMIAGVYGWPSAFLVTGAIGVLVLIAWLLLFRQPREHPSLSSEELAYIEQDGEDTSGKPVEWWEAIRHRETWYFICGKFFTDPVWYLFLFWLPSFLTEVQKLQLLPDAKTGILATVGPAMIGVYLLADIGSIGGGWISSHFIKRGWTVNRARKTTLFLAALSTTPLLVALASPNPLVVVVIIGIGMAGHQAFSSNIFAMISDLYPRRAVATVAGMGGAAGAVGGILMAQAAGRILDATGSYWPLFIYAGLAYLIAFTAIHLLVPKMDPAPVSEA